ncbi:MAG: hypothetical protein ACOCUT_03610 [bacterium]
MTINRNCLQRLLDIGLPMEVEVLSRNVKPVVLGVATINTNGTVTYSKNMKEYSSPSHLRQEIIGKNCATYKFLRCKGKLLSDLGVKPK